MHINHFLKPFEKTLHPLRHCLKLMMWWYEALLIFQWHAMKIILKDKYEVSCPNTEKKVTFYTIGKDPDLALLSLLSNVAQKSSVHRSEGEQIPHVNSLTLI